MRPTIPGAGGLLLTPGAGGSRDHPVLAALDRALTPLPVERIDFDYRKAGRRPPPRAPKLVAEVVERASGFCDRVGIAPERLVLGGRSMGGRICSMAVAEGMASAGLILLSYPLHPPGKPDKLRTEHLVDLAVPCLFVSGTRDPFGSPRELESATRSIPGPVTHCWLDGAGHDPKGCETEISEAVDAWLDSLPPV